MRSLLLCAVALVGLQDPTPAPDWSDKTIDQMIAAVQRERDQVDGGVWTELAGRGTLEAFEALQRCTALIGTESILNGVFAALATLSSDTAQDELRDLARTYLTDMAIGISWAHQRPATRALASLGGEAEPALRRVVSEHPDPRCRQLACGGLVPALEHQGDEDALELLLDWYRAPLSGPPARLERAIGRFEGGWVLPYLDDAVGDQSRPPFVRVAILRALALMPGEAVNEILLAGLRAKDTSVQLASIDALGERGAVGQERSLEKLTRSRDDAVRRAAFVALDRLRADEDWEQELLEAAGGKDVALRLGAVQAFAKRPGEAAHAALLRLLDDGSHLVRVEAALALCERREKASIPHLIERLRGDTLRVRGVMHEVLVWITGVDHGQNGERWASWWEAQGATFTIPDEAAASSAVEQREARKRENPTQAVFFGIPLDSDRVCFVLDTSGSMNRVVTTGGTRLQAATEELIAALEHFPVGGRFNLVFFASRTRTWKPGLVEMTESRLSQASKYARAQRPKGGTALHDGLLAAFEDDEVDTIVVLSDGQPTEGALTDPESILADIDHRNRLRRVVIHCVALNHRSELLEGLARLTGGRYREVQ